jgi:hypothetical protein
MRHEVCFPRYAQDIRTQKRTLFHMSKGLWLVGDTLLLCADPTFPEVARAIVTWVDRAKLRELSAEDLRLLNRDDAAAYFASWDALHPEMPSSDDPLVYRIEFRYTVGDSPSPEWCLAS